MGYVGNQQTEGYSQVPAKQDLTGATGTSLTLSHAVASAEGIDLYINNVRQEPTEAYSVVGTAVTLTGSVVATDDIYVVYNSLALQTTTPPDASVSTAKIIDGSVTSAKLAAGVQGVAGITSSSTSGTALSIDANNIVSMPSTVMYDTYRLNADTTANGVITAWEKPDNTICTTVGDSMSVSSGIFTFPRTGVYRVAYFASIDTAAADSLSTVELFATTDNSTYERIVYVREGGHSSDADYGTTFGEAVININDVANRKVRLEAGSIAAGSVINGNTDRTETYICFQYLAPAQ